MEEENENLSSKMELQIDDPAEHMKEYVEKQAKHANYQYSATLEGVSSPSCQPATII